MPLLEPKDSPPIQGTDGKARVFVLGKFPATLGREILAKYPVNALPKIGDYGVSEETMLKLMSCVAVRLDTGTVIELSTKALVDNHCHDAETLLQVEWAMLEHNFSFFGNGKTFDFFAHIGATVKAFLFQTLTDLSVASSAPEKRPSTN